MSSINRTTRTLACAALTLALTAATAEASERFASPSGTGSACTQAEPCNIVTAINDAAANDDIDIEPGSYGSVSAPIATTLDDMNNFLTIHGQAGSPPPVITSDAADGIALTGGSSLSYVDLVDTAASAFGIDVNGGTPASLYRVDVHTTGADAWACYPDGEMVDSVCWQSGPGGGGARPLVVYAASAVMVNDTIIASGSGGWGVEVIGNGPLAMTMTLTNTIVHGAGTDIYVAGDVHTGGSATVTADHSDYATTDDAATASGGTTSITPAGSGTNIKAAPAFVDSAAGNFEEAAGSPTIGTGVTDSLAGDADLAGLPWASPPDMGAYQYYAPPGCNPLSESTKPGAAVSFALTCSDALGDPVTLAIKTGPKHGALSAIGSSGSVTYTPASGFSGTDTFTYTGTSKLGTSAPTSVSVTVGKAQPGGGKRVAPVITHASQKRGVFKFTLNEAAQVTLTFELHGRMRGTVKVAGKAGPNTVRVKGRLSKHHNLKPGKYAVTITATNASGRSKTTKLKYTITGGH